MTLSEICPISGETHEEERINYWTHLIGFILSLIGAIVLLISTFFYRDIWFIASCAVYGVTLVILYGASTFYHGCKKIHNKRILRIVDHSCIYLFIAGCYTPFTLGPLRNNGGVDLFFLVWGIATIGILMKIFAFNRFQLASLFAYLAMGWLVMFSFSTFMQTISMTSIIFLILGGLSYSLGTIFFMWEKLPYNHAIWHLFVLGGSVFHYMSIFDIVLN